MIRKEKEMIYDKLERIGLYAASIPYLGELAEELKAIADALGVTFEQSFTLPDGTQYKIGN